MWVATNVDYHALMRQVYPLYLASVVLLLAVLVIGKRAFGSTRWIALPARNPSAGFRIRQDRDHSAGGAISDRTEDRCSRIARSVEAGGADLVPMALIAKEPDLGTALTYIPILAIGIFLAGMRWKYWLAIGVVALVVRARGFSTLQEYQKARIVSFLDPGARSAGHGLPADPVQDCSGRGRNLGQGSDQRKPDTASLPAGAPYGFYFFRFCRGARLYRSDGGDGFVLRFADANRAKCPDGAGPRRNVYLYGCRSAAVISYTGKCWNGSGADAGYRNTAAVDELWRIEHLVDVSDAGSGEQR